jgi:magnesium-transporting ATPase (P-type)
MSVAGQASASPTVTGAFLNNLRSIAGVQGVTLIHSTAERAGAHPGTRVFLAACDQLAHTPSFGRCPPGAEVAALSGNLDNLIGGNSNLTHRRWPAASISLQQLQHIPVDAIVVATNGSTSTTEMARTALEVAFPGSGPVTLAEIHSTNNRTVTELQQMTNVVILASLVIAGCSLAVSVTAGISDRKRPFSLLRLTGVSVDVLRKVVALEAAVPLLLIAVISTAMGFLAAGLFLRSQLSESLRVPGAEYFVIVAAGLVVSLAIIASTLPLIERITGPEVARNE